MLYSEFQAVIALYIAEIRDVFEVLDGVEVLSDLNLTILDFMIAFVIVDLALEIILTLKEE